MRTRRAPQPTLFVAVLISGLLGASPGEAEDEGSLGRDVYLDDITYTMRTAFFRSATVSPHDPNVAYVGSYDGYVWKTIDGGRTWDESRLILDARSFFGDAGQKLYFGVHRTAPGSLYSLSFGVSRLVGHAPPNRKLSLPLAASDGSAGTQVAGSFGVDPGGVGSGFSTMGGVGGGTAGGAAANVNFGIGLPGGSPRLQLLVRKLGKPTSGLNIKQMLALRGTRPTEVRLIVIHPRYPNIVFACTGFGLYKTQDGGGTWVRVFAGMNPGSRFAFHLAVDPRRPRRILLGTGDGVWVSEDLGESFSKTTSGGVGGGGIFWVTFDPHNPRYVFVTTDNGVLRSSDGGDNFDYIYYTTYPAARLVFYLAIDPFDKKRGYIATWDGLFTTPDILHGGLESWSRVGGLQLSGIHAEKIALCPKHPGHLWALVNMRIPGATTAGLIDTGGAFILESRDHGNTWKVIFSGNTFGSMQWFENDPRDPDMLWLVWSRSLSRLRRRTSEERLEKVSIPDDPPVQEVIMAAQMYTGTDQGRQLDYRRRSLLKALVPRLDVSYFQRSQNRYSLLQDGVYPTLSYFRDERFNMPYQELRVLATWDLGALVFNLDSAMFGRVDRINFEVREQVKLGVHRLYGELRRLRVVMANQPPRDLRVRLMYKLRIEELTTYVNFITGNYLTRWRQGDRPAGIATKWWEPWTNAAP